MRVIVVIPVHGLHTTYISSFYNIALQSNGLDQGLTLRKLLSAEVNRPLQSMELDISLNPDLISRTLSFDSVKCFVETSIKNPEKPQRQTFDLLRELKTLRNDGKRKGKGKDIYSVLYNKYQESLFRFSAGRYQIVFFINL